MTTLVLRGALPFDLDALRAGRTPVRSDLVLTDGVITSITPTGTLVVPDGAEVIDVTDRVVVLRLGRVVKDAPTSEFDAETLLGTITGLIDDRKAS